MTKCETQAGVNLSGKSYSLWGKKKKAVKEGMKTREAGKTRIQDRLVSKARVSNEFQGWKRM